MNQTGRGDAGSTFDTSGTTRDFPAVPYTAEHFTPRGLCPSASGRKLVTVHESSQLCIICDRVFIYKVTHCFLFRQRWRLSRPQQCLQLLPLRTRRFVRKVKLRTANGGQFFESDDRYWSGGFPYRHSQEHLARGNANKKASFSVAYLNPINNTNFK